MARVIALKLDVTRSQAQLRGVIASTCRRIELIALTAQMKNCCFGLLVKIARFPIARQAAADSNHAAQHVRMRERKTVIERAGLREAQQKDSFWISNALID